MKRRIIAFILVLGILCSFTACNRTPVSTTDTPVPTQESINTLATQAPSVTPSTVATEPTEPTEPSETPEPGPHIATGELAQIAEDAVGTIDSFLSGDTARDTLENQFNAFTDRMDGIKISEDIDSPDLFIHEMTWLIADDAATIDDSLLIACRDIIAFNAGLETVGKDFDAVVPFDDQSISAMRSLGVPSQYVNVCTVSDTEYQIGFDAMRGATHDLMEANLETIFENATKLVDETHSVFISYNAYMQFIVGALISKDADSNKCIAEILVGKEITTITIDYSALRKYAVDRFISHIPADLGVGLITEQPEDTSLDPVPLEAAPPQTEPPETTPPQTEPPETNPPQPETAPPQTESYSYSGNMVWIPKSGSKYHRTSTCSGMKNPEQVTREEAENLGYEPCKKCYG